MLTLSLRKKDDGKIYAMKVLKKKALVKRKQVQHTLTVKNLYTYNFESYEIIVLCVFVFQK